MLYQSDLGSDKSTPFRIFRRDFLTMKIFQKVIFMSREPFETMPDVMDTKQLAVASQISKAGAYDLLNSPDFPTLRIGGRKLVMKNELAEWLKSRTNRKA